LRGTSKTAAIALFIVMTLPRLAVRQRSRLANLPRLLRGEL